MKSAQASTTTLRPKQGMKRSNRTDGHGIPLPGDVRIRLDAGYDSQATRDELATRDGFFDLADAIIVRSLIRQAWTTCRWDDRPARRPRHLLAQPS